MTANNLEKFLDKIKTAKPAVGLLVTLADPTVSELAGDAGYDFTWIDMEHMPHTLQTVQGHIIAARASGCAPLVRVPWNEHGIIKPVLDLAPAGVIIPMVNSAEEAAAAVAACRYPPTGTRGCGVRRGNRYGAVPFKEYLAQATRTPLVIVQIEHVEALRNLDAILQVPGIDHFCVGPCDLSGSLGRLNEMDDPELNSLLDEASARIKAAGKYLGTAGGPLPRWKQRQVDWIALASDCGGIYAQAREIIGAAAAAGARLGEGREQ
ncbi:MAG: 4-hydroxy-3-methylbut-2-en-1-yl diphosphate synthase [Candidatus Marinimicrobia bacterium]|nr:4-hydroxy-3-methylbut-2-en-1-yl diphosphate synthase [Candidatus Neomarinimicrobiota bacterium]